MLYWSLFCTVFTFDFGIVVLGTVLYCTLCIIGTAFMKHSSLL
jgi:hypothetical protein